MARSASVLLAMSRPKSCILPDAAWNWLFVLPYDCFTDEVRAWSERICFS